MLNAGHVGQVIGAGDRCRNIVSALESGKCIVLPYNYPRQVHFLSILVWVDVQSRSRLHYVQARNSCASMTSPGNDICLNDAKIFLRKIYKRVGTRPDKIPSWHIMDPPPLTQQNQNECALHTISNMISASQGTWLTHKFDNSFVKSVREYLLEYLGTIRYMRSQDQNREHR